MSTETAPNLRTVIDTARSKKQAQGRGRGRRTGNENRNENTNNNSNNNNGAKNQQGKNKARKKKPKNTESFEPDYSAPDMRIIVANRGPKFKKNYSNHDVVIATEFFCDEDDYSVYDNLLAELDAAGTDDLFCLWHGDSHLIANDKIQGGKWKQASPNMQRVLKKMEEYFNMDIKASRFNWYKDATQWKPQHHDRAAFTPNCPQNVTVAASFGAEREACFSHDKSGAILHTPLPNGSCYAFGKDVNVDWKHGILALPEETRVLPEYTTRGRISIIAWGWNDQYAHRASEPDKLPDKPERSARGRGNPRGKGRGGQGNRNNNNNNNNNNNRPKQQQK